MPDAARRLASGIRSAVDRLLSSPAIVGRPSAKQWRFFRDCVERLLDPATASEFDDLAPVNAAQLKFAVQDKLRRFYLREGRPLDFVFTLVHTRDLPDFGLSSADYPSVASYCALVRDVAADRVDVVEPAQLKLYVERVVTEAIDAEFQAYGALPEVETERLTLWFDAEGPAFAEIVNVLRRHRDRGWIISNPWNPSTKRLLSLKVKGFDANEASVRTTEYWYLRWWDVTRESYTYPYRETNRQLYIVRFYEDDNRWKVFENIRPSPRTSIPYKRIAR